MLDQRGRLLRAALGFAALQRPSYDRAVWALRTWLDSWPGIGAQGGDVERTVLTGLNSQRKGLIISSSREIIFAENPGEQARKLRDQINQKR